MNDALGPMWESHKDFLRRLLIGLSRDIDLANDLLQETYLRAEAGMSGYRGGDARAWLATIARNLYNGHLRRKYVVRETPIDLQEDLAAMPLDHDLHIDVRHAIAELDPASRTALLMKHYGGFTYKDIAERLHCPVGTAKWRVSAALDRLRRALGVGEELTEMKCSELDGARLLDYIDGLLSPNESKSIEAHLARCPSCQERVEQFAHVLRALDAVENDYKITMVFELDKDGGFTNYGWFSLPNTSEEPTEVFEFGQTGVTYMTIQGKEVHPEPIVGHEGKYRARLSPPIAPKQSINMHWAAHQPESREIAVKLDNGNWRFGPGKLDLTETLLYVVAVRLPSGASVVKPEPEPQEIRTNGATTVIWRDALPPNQPIEFWLEYKL